MDEWVMRLGLLVILCVVGYFVWSWWSSTQTKVEKMDAPSPPGPAPDPIPQGPGITMYGTDSCPWCVKQKDYFKEKNMEYTYVDCMNSKCPNFVTGYPTVVRNGQLIHGFSELV
jgi:Glutaredoxin